MYMKRGIWKASSWINILNINDFLSFYVKLQDISFIYIQTFSWYKQCIIKRVNIFSLIEIEKNRDKY